MAASTRKKTTSKSSSRATKAASGKRAVAKKPAARGGKAVARGRTRKTAARAGGSAAGAAVAPRRAIFIDVENTSNEDALSKVIDLLKIDRAQQATEFYAVGNWRAVGQGMSRHLARLGASLVHSAPVTGVRDWSDLWIAVAAGRWIALARPGDLLDIVSNDKAFEAVGDAAASAGIVFRRLPHKVTAAAAAAAAEESADGRQRRRRRRGGRGRRRGGKAPAQPRASTPQQPRESRRPEPAARVAASDAAASSSARDHGMTDGHGATHEQILNTIRRLTGSDPSRWVNLDAIANALKAEGFTRPPGSPRLVVRLRRMKDIEVQPNGLVRVVG
jgi:hypothetical protein